MQPLATLVDALRASRGFAHKRDIADALGTLAANLAADGRSGLAAMGQGVPNGDDCAAIPQPDGSHLLLAIEGFVEDFVERMPWFAGWCGVMVNLSDVAAMGGRPLAVVDALWSRGRSPADEVLAGMAAASAAYGVPIVGGHSNYRSERGQLAVAVLGRAERALLTSFDARPGDRLLMAVDLQGAWQEPFPYWNAATTASPERLRQGLALLPAIAEAGLCRAAKDISMAGVLGTALMLIECSKVGATIDLDRLPRPPGAELLRWLTAFPSYGYLLGVPPAQAATVAGRFEAAGIACADIGMLEAGSRLQLQRRGADGGIESALLWDWARERFIAARAAGPTAGDGSDGGAGRA